MRRYEIYKEFNNQNYLEIKFDKSSVATRIVNESADLLELRNKLLCKVLLGKRKKPSSPKEDKQNHDLKASDDHKAAKVEETSRNISNLYPIRNYSILYGFTNLQMMKYCLAYLKCW